MALKLDKFYQGERVIYWGKRTLWRWKDTASNSNSAISVMKAKLLNLSISLLNFKMGIVIPIHSGGVKKLR